MKEFDDALADELGLVDAHDVAGIRQDFDLASGDVALGASFGWRNVSDQPVLAAEEHQRRRRDLAKLSGREVERLTDSSFGVSHDPHPWTEPAVHCLALTQRSSDDRLQLGCGRPESLG